MTSTMNNHPTRTTPAPPRTAPPAPRRKAGAPMTFTDEHPPHRDNPVAPAHRSAGAEAKASAQHDSQGNPLRSFRGLLDHLATLTRNQVRYHHTNTEIPMLTHPTPDQRRAFTLIGAPIALTAK